MMAGDVGITSDHFAAWIALGAAGIALVSALAGNALSAFFESRRAAARRDHEDRTEKAKRDHEASIRFHDERLIAYSDYLMTTSTLFAAAGTWLDNGKTEPFTAHAARQDALPPYIKAMTRVTFLAKSEVLAKVGAVHDFVNRLVNRPSEDISQTTIDEANEAVTHFEIAAKSELGID